MAEELAGVWLDARPRLAARRGEIELPGRDPGG